MQANPNQPSLEVNQQTKNSDLVETQTEQESAQLNDNKLDKSNEEGAGEELSKAKENQADSNTDTESVVASTLHTESPSSINSEKEETTQNEEDKGNDILKEAEGAEDKGEEKEGEGLQTAIETGEKLDDSTQGSHSEHSTTTTEEREKEELLSHTFKVFDRIFREELKNGFNSVFDSCVNSVAKEETKGGVEFDRKLAVALVRKLWGPDFYRKHLFSKVLDRFVKEIEEEKNEEEEQILALIKNPKHQNYCGDPRAFLYKNFLHFLDVDQEELTGNPKFFKDEFGEKIYPFLRKFLGDSIITSQKSDSIQAGKAPLIEDKKREGFLRSFSNFLFNKENKFSSIVVDSFFYTPLLELLEINSKEKIEILKTGHLYFNIYRKEKKDESLLEDLRKEGIAKLLENLGESSAWFGLKNSCEIGRGWGGLFGVENEIYPNSWWKNGCELEGQGCKFTPRNQKYWQESFLKLVFLNKHFFQNRKLDLLKDMSEKEFEEMMFSLNILNVMRTSGSPYWQEFEDQWIEFIYTHSELFPLEFSDKKQEFKDLCLELKIPPGSLKSILELKERFAREDVLGFLTNNLYSLNSGQLSFLLSLEDKEDSLRELTFVRLWENYFYNPSGTALVSKGHKWLFAENLVLNNDTVYRTEAWPISPLDKESVERYLDWQDEVSLRESVFCSSEAAAQPGEKDLSSDKEILDKIREKVTNYDESVASENICSTALSYQEKRVLIESFFVPISFKDLLQLFFVPKRAEVDPIIEWCEKQRTKEKNSETKDYRNSELLEKFARLAHYLVDYHPQFSNILTGGVDLIYQYPPMTRFYDISFVDILREFLNFEEKPERYAEELRNKTIDSNALWNFMWLAVKIREETNNEYEPTLYTELGFDGEMEDLSGFSKIDLRLWEKIQSPELRLGAKIEMNWDIEQFSLEELLTGVDDSFNDLVFFNADKFLQPSFKKYFEEKKTLGWIEKIEIYDEEGRERVWGTVEGWKLLQYELWQRESFHPCLKDDEPKNFFNLRKNLIAKNNGTYLRKKAEIKGDECPLVDDLKKAQQEVDLIIKVKKKEEEIGEEEGAREEQEEQEEQEPRAEDYRQESPSLGGENIPNNTSKNESGGGGALVLFIFISVIIALAVVAFFWYSSAKPKSEDSSLRK